jgi:hypothetical protein
MPLLPLAILVVAVLTIAALALILFPPGEGGVQVVEGDITDGAGGEAAEDELADTDDGGITGANLAPPPPVEDASPQEESEVTAAETKSAPEPTRRGENSSA